MVSNSFIKFFILIYCLLSFIIIIINMVDRMVDFINIDKINTWSDPAIENEIKLEGLNRIVDIFSDGTFPRLDNAVKEAFISYICSLNGPTELLQLSLQLLRIILRDKSCADLDCFVRLQQLLSNLTYLAVGQHQVPKKVVLEAEKCLVNLLFNSAKARAVFQGDPFNKLLPRILMINGILFGEQIDEEKLRKPNELFTDWNENELEELQLYDLKIIFVLTAQVPKLQADCITDVDRTLIFQKIISTSLKKLESSELQQPIESTMHWKYLNESLKILFNFYHKAKIFDLDAAQFCANECAKIIRNQNLDEHESKQNAVNLLAVMPSTLPELCPQLGSVKEEKNELMTQEGCDMRFVDALLHTFETQIDKHEEGKELALSEHLAMFLTVLNQLCTEHKPARRYCRMKVIPPLKAEDVERRPDEGVNFRNKIVRMMTDTGRCGELAAEFLFVLCKRTVGRLIKYCGFGHSAGLLANYGFLGQALGPKHASDSEDSETDEYKQVEEKINPVTGYIPPSGQLEELQKQLDSMSEEQKEYEVMKLVEAMDKLMDQGLIAPGTIGDDGRPRQVKHVAELIKDAKEGEDSDSD